MKFKKNYFARFSQHLALAPESCATAGATLLVYEKCCSQEKNFYFCFWCRIYQPVEMLHRSDSRILFT